VKFLQSLGFDAEVLKLTGPTIGVSQALPKWRRTNQMDWHHTVVRVHNTIIDLTYRQFMADSDYPLIMSQQELNKKWSEIDVEEKRSGDGE
jgi:hypothetical protein